QEGVFMQMYQPVEPDDFELVQRLGYELRKDNYRSICAKFKDLDARGACLREAWPLFREGVVSGSGVKNFCSGHPTNLEEACYLTASSIVGRMNLSNPQSAVLACNRFPAEFKLQCFETVAQAFLEEDRNDGTRAILICQESDDSIARSCLMDLAQKASFIFARESPEAARFCAKLPPEFASVCTAGISSQTHVIRR
ncbi:MAG: hypothetical protein RIQ56_258, partial [Candidatus Parcubacteria bacterium]